jgi:D-glycero-alpha-D-manno-heptose-7-phosphate kinase
VEAVTLQKTKIKELQNHFMLIFTGLSRYASGIASEQIKNTHTKEKELKAMSNMVGQAIDILNSDRDIVEFGNLLHESWMIKKELSSKISNPHIDGLYEKALKHGAIGGKLLGAGGGGFLLLFVRPENRDKAAAGLKDFLEVQFAFENEGSQIIYYNP